MKPNPEHAKALAAFVDTSSFPALLSMRMNRLEMGAAEFAIDVEPKHRQLMGVVHGGVMAALIDTAAFWAVYFAIEDETKWLTSVDLKLNYLAPATDGRLIALGFQVKAGRTLCYADARVVDESGKILAHGASTLMIVPVTGPAAGISLPPKFLPE
jgi:uncharacterized protein (TIGR00369 family)